MNTQNFKTAVLHKDSYIDKSLLIKEILKTSSTNIVISCPQKWGKTLNMDMIKTFFNPRNDDAGYFKNLYLFTGGKDNVKFKLDKTKCLKIITEDNGYY
ncbi:unnamed protein product [Blepharisma stoltei]|uniref:AAA-ATPase-like domain-containing protein n=1 Tax=Blepharisma stoltei TaxID=1481888 RepID=A0AAU9IZS5_9CILI|nr:unnamed protein product [Blepharisma stoltei]